MAGRRIRWASAGKAIAVGAAVLAALASLPALLGGPEPPELPEDVGVAGIAPDALTPVEAPVPPQSAPGPLGREVEDPRTARPRRRQLRPGRRDRGRPDPADQTRESRPDPPPPVSPLTVERPAPPAPAPSREFRFER